MWKTYTLEQMDMFMIWMINVKSSAKLHRKIMGYQCLSYWAASIAKSVVILLLRDRDFL